MTDGDQLADDIVQTVWLRVVRGLPKLRDPRAFPAWMFSIARRTVVDRFRYDRGDTVELAESHDVEDGLDLRLTRAVVVAAVGALPPLEREVVELHHLVDLSIADVAGIVGVPEGTVKSRLARARRLLAPTLRGLIEGSDDE